MTTATREDLLRLAEGYEMRADFTERMARAGYHEDASGPESRDGEVTEYRTIAHALRRLAEAEGQEAEPVAWQWRARFADEKYGAPPLSQMQWRDGRIPPAFTELPDFYEAEERPLYASPPPAPGYAEGRRDGLEEAATYHDNAAAGWRKADIVWRAREHEADAAAIRARALNKDSTDA